MYYLYCANSKTAKSMKRYIHIISLICVIIPITSALGPSQSNHTKNYEAHASEILMAASQRMQKVWNRQRELFLNASHSRGYHVINQGSIKQQIDRDVYDTMHYLAGNLSTIPIALVKNATLKRQIQRLSKLKLMGLPRPDYDSARDKLRAMQNFLTERTVCILKNIEDCSQSLAMIPGIIYNSMRTQRLQELEHYWVKWRKNINDRNKARNAFSDYIQLFRTAAHYNGHVTPSRTWYLNYDTENFLHEMENVVLEIMPLYHELHAYLRESVRRHYGDSVIDKDDAISAPIFEQLVHQAWYTKTVFVEPYPEHSLPAIQTRLQQVMANALKVNTNAAEFFQSLGMNRMDDSFYKNFSRRMNAAETGGDCKPEAFYFPPEVGLRYCPKIDYKKYMQMHGIMAELQYNMYKRHLPFGLDEDPCPGFGAAVGEAAVIASGTPRHLSRLLILKNDSLSDESAMNRLFRMAVHTVLAIPQYYIYDRFFVDALDGRIKPEEYNCKYWHLQFKYAGVVPPTKRSDEHFDLSYRFYRGLQSDKSNTIKFMSEVLGMSFYRAFCLASGSYRPSEKTRPLHNCDFYGSTKAGDMIKNMMKLGATKQWRDVMETATGERKLTGKGVMEYFAPLYSWLRQYNEKNGLFVGWEGDSNCSNE